MIFLPILIIISISAFAAYLSDKKIEETIAVSIFIISIALYFFALIGQLKYGVYFVGILGVCSIAFLIVKSKNVYYIFFDRIFTPALVAFFIMFLISLHSNTGRLYSQWDEYMHWGPHIKLLFIFDELYTRADTLIEHQSYLPITQLFAYWLNKTSGAYSEGTSLTALNIIMYMLLLPLLSKIRWRYFYKIFVFILIIYLVPLVVFQTHNSYNSLLMDIHIGLLFGYILYIYFSEKKSIMKQVIICSSITFLVLTKDSGILFALVVLGVIFIDNIVKKEKSIRNWAFSIIPLSLSIFLPKFAWELELKIFSVVRDRHDPNNISLSKILSLPNENINHYTVKTIINFFESLGQRFITDYTIKLSYIGWVCLLILASVFIVKFFVKDSILKKRYSYCFAVIFVGAAAYAAALLLVWCFSFPENRAIVLGSFDRYLASYLMGIVTLLLFIAIHTNVVRNIEYYSLIIILLCAEPSSFFNITVLSNYSKEQTNINMRQYSKIPRIAKIVNTETDKVWLLNREENETIEMYISRYKMLPMKINGLYQSYEEIMPSVSEWEKILYEQYQYVYILNYSEQFWEDYSSIFNSETLNNDSLYKVIKGEQGRVTLEEETLYRPNNELAKEFNIDEYFKKLNNPNYIVLLSLSGDGSKLVSDNINTKLEQIGAKIFPNNEKNWSYIGVFENNNTIHESLKEKSSIYENRIYNTSFKIISEADEYGCYSSIEIDGANYSTSYEGLNIVVFDKITRDVADSACIYLGDGQVELVRD